MKKDSSLVLFDYPLDVEYTDEYLDSRTSTNPDAIPQYYTAVPVTATVTTTITPRVLEDLYIPEEDPYFDDAIKGSGKASKADKDELFTRLLREAYILTENEDQLDDKKVQSKNENQNKGWIFGTRWTPSGNIQIWDNTFSGFETVRVSPYYEYYPCEGGDTTIQDPNQPAQITPIDDGGSTGTCQRAVYNYKKVPTDGQYVPLVGAQVLMRQWFTIRQGITDANGNFSTRSLKGNARYIIQWERHQYSIRNGSIFQAETRGPRVKEQAWNKKIKGGDDEYHGMIHTAAYDYYYGSRFGLTSPSQNSFLKRQMKLGARELDGESSHIPFFSMATKGIVPQIFIKAWGEPSDVVYGTTIHELAHSAHRETDRPSYSNIVWDAYTNVCFSTPIFQCNENLGPTANNNRRLMETWARTVEIAFANERYARKFTISGYEYKFNNYQNFGILDDIHYTSAGWDMIDNTNQRFRYGLTRPIDRVSGYTLKQLEDALIGARSWNQWRDNIKNMYNNSTEQYIDELFANWPN
ncbi:hypothetical protein JM83_0858 [Gillisia sp. Hel_I_86]|uniref:hypothetical protein n=1 Tax=Gillisia sp. Hel_I_86 TaxID=1249981 RepID=UPI001198FFFE|nr:hypothetical protein [Gillisia sp. Hel_I_86]TVZ25917.1 hypothetical protein JM83_0858 [Gillisia sp. Hel_I_86]